MKGSMKITIPSHLSDAALVAEVRFLAGREWGVTAQLIAHLAEFDARRLYLPAGFPSLFAYCVEVLRLSESEAYNRIEAARAARKFPVILDRLAEGSLNMTTVRLLASHLTADNHPELWLPHRERAGVRSRSCWLGTSRARTSPPRSGSFRRPGRYRRHPSRAGARPRQVLRPRVQR
jgi:hypothetical protein